MKRYHSILYIITLLALAIGLGGCTNAIQALRARDQLNKGVNAFKGANYPVAVEHFKEAVRLDPSFMNARLYLATSYFSQYVPGAPSEENVRNAAAAREGFMGVLERDPNNASAVEFLGSLAFNEKNFNDAKKWNQKLIELDSNNKTAYYTLGVIDYYQCFQPQTETWAKLGMKPEDQGPIKDKKAREELRDKNQTPADDGMKMLEKAIAVDPDYDDAMAYLSLMYRQKAYIAETPEENKDLWAKADEMLQKTMATRKKKAESPKPKS